MYIVYFHCSGFNQQHNSTCIKKHYCDTSCKNPDGKCNVIVMVSSQFWHSQPAIVLVWFGFMVFNATFNNISVVSWPSVLLVEETGVPGANHWPVVSHSCFKIFLHHFFYLLGWREVMPWLGSLNPYLSMLIK